MKKWTNPLIFQPEQLVWERKWNSLISSRFLRKNVQLKESMQKTSAPSLANFYAAIKAKFREENATKIREWYGMLKSGTRNSTSWMSSSQVVSSNSWVKCCHTSVGLALGAVFSLQGDKTDITGAGLQKGLRISLHNKRAHCIMPRSLKRNRHFPLTEEEHAC